MINLKYKKTCFKTLYLINCKECQVTKPCYIVVQFFFSVDHLFYYCSVIVIVSLRVHLPVPGHRLWCMLLVAQIVLTQKHNCHSAKNNCKLENVHIWTTLIKYCSNIIYNDLHKLKQNPIIIRVNKNWRVVSHISWNQLRSWELSIQY